MILEILIEGKDIIIIEIISINNYDYTLTDGNNNYNLNLEFYDLDTKLNIGDIIYIPRKLLINNGVYAYGKIIKSEKQNIEEYIKIIYNNKEIYLQRYYG